MAETARKTETPLLIHLGWYEYVDLPEWKVRGLRAKIDTGARTSAIHVDRIEELPGGRVRFEVVRRRDHARQRVVVETAIRRRGRVKASTGHRQTRIFVATRLRIGPLEREVEVSLVDRTEMRFRMLLGRSTLAGWPVVIDVGRACLTGRPAKRRRKRGAREDRDPLPKRKDL